MCAVFVTITAFGCLLLKDSMSHHLTFKKLSDLLSVRSDQRFPCLVLAGMEAGAVGLALSYAVTLMGMFQWGVRQSAEVENMVRTSFTLSTRLLFYTLKLNRLRAYSQMTSVERVLEYTELENEAPWETQKRPPADWPNRGLITFDRLNFSYSSDGPVVLKNISAMFRPKEKVSLAQR